MLPFLNTLTLIIAIGVNYWANSGVMNGRTVRDISEQYNTLFTPAGYAFSIWGIIYLGLLIFCGYQWYMYSKTREADKTTDTGPWFVVANLANAAWVVAWLNKYIGLSVFLIMVILFSLIQLTFRLDLERWDPPVRVLAFVWWPLTVYLGWIIVATVANVAAFIVSMDLMTGQEAQEIWTVIMIVVAAFIYAALILTRNMREAAAVGIWALIAIAVRHWNEYPSIVVAALASAALLAVYVGYHAYINRATGPLQKLRRGEW